MEELKIGKFYKLTREFCNNFKLSSDVCKVWAIKGSTIYFQNNNQNYISNINYFGDNIINEKIMFTTSSVKTEPVKTEPVKTEPVKTEPVKTEPVKTEPVKTEPVKTEPVKTEPVKTEPVKTEPMQQEQIDQINPYGEDYI